MQCIRVDLPEPDGPMIAVKLPVAIATLIPSTARTACGPVPYVLIRFRVLTATVARSVVESAGDSVVFMITSLSAAASGVTSEHGRPCGGGRSARGRTRP